MADDKAGTSAAQATSHPFQAEVAKLLQLMVHSVYSDRDVFLREARSSAKAGSGMRKEKQMPLNDEEVFGGAVASPMRVTPEEQAQRDRLAADLKADELNNPDNPLHPTDQATRAALTRDLARTEAKAAPKAAPSLVLTV